VDLSPAAVMAMWAAGASLGLAVVAWWGVVGPGFVWLAAGVGLLLGLPAALARPAGWIGVSALVVVAVMARRRSVVTAGALVASASWLGMGALESHPAAALTGALFLGAVTAEMMLGHWYLVDPTLPRWALRRLVIAAIAGAVLDGLTLALLGGLDWTPADQAVGWGLVALWATSLLLLAGVYGALRESGYSGVMAATGLSYLALLTAIGAAVVGRMLASGPVLT
jgi:hypothetical protein